MEVLIVGLGYAGTRFLRAFHYLSHEYKINIAYVAKQKKLNDLLYFSDVPTALKNFNPAIVVIAVNDTSHALILQQLTNYTGFIICEKPLVTPQDDLQHLFHLKAHTGFCLNLIERYSEVTLALKQYVQTEKLKFLRGNFYWGKDRINDRRPTCGVVSEIIHAIDLMSFICEDNSTLQLDEMIGTRSDFSISGANVLDSVALTAALGEASITGYSSFVNIVRKRELHFSFMSPQNNIVYAQLIYDTPSWDWDSLHIWERNHSGEKTLLQLNTQFDFQPLLTIQKLYKMVYDVVRFVKDKKIPAIPFADLQTAITLQNILNKIDNKTKTVGPVRYIVGPDRTLFYDESNWERLG